MIKHENAIIARMVKLGSVRRYDHLLRAEFFNGENVDIYNALRLYESQYGVCMDEATFRYQFPAFTWIEGDVQVEWFADELAQDYVKAKVGTLLQETIEELENNPKEVTRNLQTGLSALAPYLGDAIAGRVGLIEHGRERLRKYEQRKVYDNSLSGITSGFALIDECTNGTHEGEIEMYVARPGNGKSLWLLYGCFRAWQQQGKRISFVSPEMTAFEMGVRLDTMLLNLSSTMLQSGKMSGDALDNYSDRIEAEIDAAKNDIAFRDSLKLGRKFTTGDVRRIIEEDKPDLLALDGILLIEPVTKYKDTRSRVTNIMDELKAIVVQTGIPMRLAHQANREPEARITRSSTTTKAKRSPLDGIPHLHELAESGSTEQYANRVFCMRLDAGRIWSAIRKNRNMPGDKYFSARFDIDIGKVSDEKFEDPDNPTDPKVPTQQKFNLPADTDEEELETENEAPF